MAGYISRRASARDWVSQGMGGYPRHVGAGAPILGMLELAQRSAEMLWHALLYRYPWHVQQDAFMGATVIHRSAWQHIDTRSVSPLVGFWLRGFFAPGFPKAPLNGYTPIRLLPEFAMARIMDLTMTGATDSVCRADLASPSRSSSKSTTASFESSPVALSEVSQGESTLPSLLTSAPVFTVKNTFIDDIVRDEDEGSWARTARRVRTWAASTRDLCSTPCNAAGMAMTPLQPLPLGQQGEAREEAALGVEPLESRQPQESVGSALHLSGDCRPCAWFWRPQGCGNGAQCRHCHMCTEGELKRKRYVNKGLARALKLKQSGKGSPAV